MPRQFKQARLINNLKMTEAAEKLGISQPTLSAWEGERKSPSIDGLEKMSDLYGVTTDFLLGRSEQGISVQSVPIAPDTLPIFHGNQSGLRSMDGCWLMPAIILYCSQMDRPFRLLTPKGCLRCPS